MVVVPAFSAAISASSLPTVKEELIVHLKTLKVWPVSKCRGGGGGGGCGEGGGGGRVSGGA